MKKCQSSRTEGTKTILDTGSTDLTVYLIDASDLIIPECDLYILCERDQEKYPFLETKHYIWIGGLYDDFMKEDCSVHDQDSLNSFIESLLDYYKNPRSLTQKIFDELDTHVQSHAINSALGRGRDVFVFSRLVDEFVPQNELLLSKLLGLMSPKERLKIFLNIRSQKIIL